jgi:hypothetical protein
VRNIGERAGRATTTLTGSTISGNTTAYLGAGVYNFAYLGSAVVALVQSTLTGNTAGGKGGGIFNYG